MTLSLSGRRAARGAVLPVLLLVLWETASRAQWVDTKLLPPIEAVLDVFIHELTENGLLGHLVASLSRNLTGFAIGSALGAAFGALLGLSRAADYLLGPSFHGFKQIARLAWIPLLSIWFGFAESAKVVFIALSAFVPVALNTYEGVRRVPQPLIEVGRALQFSTAQFVFKVFLPSALPSILVGLQLALIYSWLGTVAAEYFMAVGPGIGGLIVSGRDRFEMELVMLGVVLLGSVGFVLSLIASRASHYLLRWQRP